jgi:hypothetical protein
MLGVNRHLPERRQFDYGLDGEVDFPAESLTQQGFAFRSFHPQPSAADAKDQRQAHERIP